MTTLKPLGAYSSTAELYREAKELEAKIDRLMLEYCPDEMTPEQLANWASHQRALAPDRTNTKQLVAERVETLKGAK